MFKVLLILLNIVFLYSFTLKDANNFYKDKDYKKAYEIYKQLAKKGNLTAANNLAFMYYYGIGTQLDQKKAVNILEHLLKKNPNNPNIMYNLAVMYYKGYFDNNTLSIIVKRKDAKKLFKKSMELGNKNAEYMYNKLFQDINATKKK